MSKICLVSSAWLREWSPRTTFRPLGLKGAHTGEDAHQEERTSSSQRCSGEGASHPLGRQ